MFRFPDWRFLCCKKCLTRINRIGLPLDSWIRYCHETQLIQLFQFMLHVLIVQRQRDQLSLFAEHLVQPDGNGNVTGLIGPIFAHHHNIECFLCKRAARKVCRFSVNK